MNPGSLGCWCLGIDPSLTRSAAVLAPPGWTPGDWGSLRSGCFGEKPPDKASLTPPDYERARIQRMARIAESLVEFVIRTVPAGATVRGFIELYAYSKGNEANAASLREFGGILRYWMILRLGLPLEPIGESTARKLLLGKCPRRDRKAVTEAALKSAGAPFENADECDAFAIMNAGISELGGTHLCLYSGTQEELDSGRRGR